MNIDLSALKNIKISAIKKHMSLVIPGLIAVVALLLLIPTNMIGNSLKEEMDKSVRQGRTVSSLSDVHPFADVKIEKRYQDAFEADAKRIEEIAKQTTQRELVSYDIFPEPKSNSIQLYSNYGNKYREMIRELVKSIGARGAPTDSEIQRELRKRGTELSENTTSRSGNRTSRGRGRDSQDIAEAITETKKKKHAEQIPVYAKPGLFSWYGFWKDYEVEDPDQAIKDCWYSQLAFWVYEDVVDTIGKINAGSNSIFTSDVKRLVGVNFSKFADYSEEKSTNYYRPVSSGRTKTRDYPEYVVSEEDDSVFNFPPWTKRTCDENIDVIQFSVSVLVESSAVFPFIEELCSEKEHKFRGYPDPDEEVQTFKHNQITVLQYWQEALDRSEDVHAKYRYGDGAVVQLTLTCEYIFYRSGYDVIKPPSIQKRIEKILETLEESKKKMNRGY